MGFSVSATYALLFFGVLFAVGTLHATAANTVEDVRDAQQYQNGHLADLQGTDVFVADVAVTDVTACTVEVSANNTGDTHLSVESTDVLVDGVYEPDVAGSSAVDGDGDTDLWAPGEQLTVDLGDQPAPPDRVAVVTGPGVTDATEVSGLTC